MAGDSIHEAKRHEETVITRGERPAHREFDFDQGITIVPDDFDAPLAQDIVDAFEQ